MATFTASHKNQPYVVSPCLNTSIEQTETGARYQWTIRVSTQNNISKDVQIQIYSCDLMNPISYKSGEVGFKDMSETRKSKRRWSVHESTGENNQIPDPADVSPLEVGKTQRPCNAIDRFTRGGGALLLERPLLFP